MSISIAPMVRISTSPFRYLMRLLSHHCIVYTPMLVSNFMKYGNIEHINDRLKFHPLEQPIIAQIAGNYAELLSIAARKCYHHYHYHGININVGCPAKSASTFGINQMLLKNRTSFISSIKELKQNNPTIPISIKCRIGVSNQKSYDEFKQFIDQCMEVNYDQFTTNCFT